MVCTCGNNMIRVWVPWVGHGAWLCTRCGHLAYVNYSTGRKVVLWRPRRYGGQNSLGR